jgi:DNA-binding IclR family transcriptional regulator
MDESPSPVALPAGEVASNRSIARAARLLELFSVERPALTLREIAARLALSRATAHRYATALRHAGLLRFAGGAYTLGPRIVELSSAALAGLGVAKLGGAHLERLVARTRHTAVLSVWDGEAPIVVRVADNAERLVRIVVATGTRLPPESAQAQVFRAFGDDRAGAGLDGVRRAGFARHAHVVDGIAALAAPIFQGRDLVASVALVGTAVAIELHGDGLAGALCDAAAAFSAELGFVSPERSDA